MIIAIEPDRFWPKKTGLHVVVASLNGRDWSALPAMTMGEVWELHYKLLEFLNGVSQDSRNQEEEQTIKA